MNRVFETYNDLCSAITGEIINALSRKPAMLLCIAAGHTSLGVFRSLNEAFESGVADFSRASFVAMDEWLGMTEQTPNSCGAFLRREFLNCVNFHSENIRLFDGAALDKCAECKSVEAFIAQRGGIDYLVLGAGMNGHLALNEPGSPFDSRTRVTQTDAVTAQVGQKYFEGNAELDGGITLGVANLREARRSVLMLAGAHKREILKKILFEEISPAIPATAVRQFENADIYCDRAAGQDMFG